MNWSPSLRKRLFSLRSLQGEGDTQSLARNKSLWSRGPLWKKCCRRRRGMENPAETQLEN